METMERATETKEVKAALRAVGMNPLKVSHGRGTAWGWLHVKLGVPDLIHQVTMPDGTRRDMTRTERIANDFPRCVDGCSGCSAYRKIDEEALSVVQRVTGRKGDYDGRVSIDSEVQS